MERRSEFGVSCPRTIESRIRGRRQIEYDIVEDSQEVVQVVQ